MNTARKKKDLLCSQCKIRNICTSQSTFSMMSKRSTVGQLSLLRSYARQLCFVSLFVFLCRVFFFALNWKFEKCAFYSILRLCFLLNFWSSVLFHLSDCPATKFDSFIQMFIFIHFLRVYYSFWSIHFYYFRNYLHGELQFGHYLI